MKKTILLACGILLATSAFSGNFYCEKLHNFVWVGSGEIPLNGSPERCQYNKVTIKLKNPGENPDKYIYSLTESTDPKNCPNIANSDLIIKNCKASTRFPNKESNLTGQLGTNDISPKVSYVTVDRVILASDTGNGLYLILNDDHQA